MWLSFGFWWSMRICSETNHPFADWRCAFVAKHCVVANKMAFQFAGMSTWVWFSRRPNLPANQHTCGFDKPIWILPRAAVPDCWTPVRFAALPKTIRAVKKCWVCTQIQIWERQPFVLARVVARLYVWRCASQRRKRGGVEKKRFSGRSGLLKSSALRGFVLNNPGRLESDIFFANALGRVLLKPMRRDVLRRWVSTQRAWQCGQGRRAKARKESKPRAGKVRQKEQIERLPFQNVNVLWCQRLVG